MADLTADTFFEELKAMYPNTGPLTPDAVLKNPWFLVAAVAFSASKRPEAVPAVFAFALAELTAAQGSESGSEERAEQRVTLIRKIREALLQSGLLSGMPRVIESCIALHTVTSTELRETKLQRDPLKSMEDYVKNGREYFNSMFRETAGIVNTQLHGAYQDLGWFCETVGCGMAWGGTSILTQVETSFILVAALIAVDAPRQTTWHLANAQHSGATFEQILAVRRIAMTVAGKAGVAWRSGVPEAVPI